MVLSKNGDTYTNFTISMENKEIERHEIEFELQTQNMLSLSHTRIGWYKNIRTLVRQLYLYLWLIYFLLGALV